MHAPSTGTGTVKLESCDQTAELHFLRLRVEELERERAELTAENQRLQSMLVHEIPGLLSSMWQTLDHVNGQHPITMVTDSGLGNRQPAVSMAARGVEYSPEVKEEGPLWEEEAALNSQADMNQVLVEVFPGSGVLCDARSWQAANEVPSPTAMARLLLLGVFDMDTLMNSNLRGGRSRRSAFQQQRNALDPHKTNAIFNAILARFPLAKRGLIGSCINSKLSEIRFHSRRANQSQRFV
ncbi:uncharacterized protein LOC114476707 [Gouania willdenowi]|uniref:uncharacterized protein LOC114476707 n=1 Tax=Gouania willdenowi TaxID=441366 RepID=UPI001055CA8A|nr:uncharacterized protein LOC114476707 [Gouania willdenowi]